MMRRLLETLILLTVQWLLCASAAAEPGAHGKTDSLNGRRVALTDLENADSTQALRRAMAKPLLRIMPLGASISQGTDGSVVETLQSGYRKLLREKLRYLGYPVNMVGSRNHGAFTDHQHEGWPGAEIDGVASKMLSVVTTQKPNLVLILLGSNDCFHAKRDGNLDYARSAKDRLMTMLEKIYELSPGVTIILATLPATTDNSDAPYIEAANEGYRELVRDLQNQTRKIELADMYTDWFSPNDHSDAIHFNTAGYAKMAAVFADTFNQVADRGWLSPPIDTGMADSPGCYPTPDGFRGPIRTQQRRGFYDGDFKFSLVLEPNNDMLYNGSTSRSLLGHFRFANLVKLPGEDHPHDELIRVLDSEDREGNNLSYVSYHTNHGNAEFSPNSTEIDVKQQCLSKDVQWGDVNGDMLADFICLDADGIPTVSLNRGGEPPKFEYIGTIRGEKSVRSKIRLADIDGDGRVDYCVVEPDGVYCWRNAGMGDAPIAKYGEYWEPMVINGKTLELDSHSNSTGARFIDINGNGRADAIYIHDDTRTDIHINQRMNLGDGPSQKPYWHKFPSQIEGWPDDKTMTREHVLFGRVFGSGRSDVIRMEQVGKGFGYVFNFYRNTDNGGTQVQGDGARYCDMYGRGYDDYLWISANGEIDLFENIQSLPRWTPHGRILETARDRKFMHVGDWDGDGLCDILAVDRLNGNVDMWRNIYKQGESKPRFDNPIRVINDTLCPQPIVNGNLYDLAVRFGDLDGDKRVDYICMDPNGRSLAWLNKPNGLQTLPSTSPNQIKIAEGFDRSDHRWADVNGDGRVDFLAINKSSTAVSIWINLGTTPSLTSGMTWDRQPQIWIQGVDRSANVHFPQLTRSRRADYHVVYPQTRVADTWFNKGTRAGGERDDADVRDPGLPTVPTRREA